MVHRPVAAPAFRRGLFVCGVALGTALTAAGAPDDALFAPSPFVEATAAFEQGDIARAETLALPLASGEQATAEGCSLLGQVRLQQKRPADAVALFERAVAMKPASVQFRSRLGEALLAQARSGAAEAREAGLQRARDELERAAREDAGCLDAQLGLLRLHLLEPSPGDAGAAARHAEAAVTLDPLSATYDVAKLAEDHGRFDLAERYYAAADRLFPGNPWLQFKQAAMVARLGRTEEARARLEAILKAYPGFAPVEQALAALPAR